MRVRADQRKCQAYANCILAAPDVFDLDDASGKVVVLEETPTDERRAAVQEAVRNCPTQAITVDAETRHVA
jgi:ferredoxin